MSSDDPTLPRWVLPDMHGFRARLPRRGSFEIAMVQVGAAVFVSVLVLAVLTMVSMGALVSLAGGGLDVGPLMLGGGGLALAVALSGFLARMFQRWRRDPVLRVTLHTFQYSDPDGRFWELPLSALASAEAVRGVLVVHRKHGAEPLRFESYGASGHELRVIAWFLSRLIADQGEEIEPVPEALAALRRPGATGQRV
ncbi:MAG: hypothetical protein R3F61_13615 [Myxococcota bacterium]